MQATLLGHRIVRRGTQRGRWEKLLIVIAIFNGLGAIVGGLALMARPDGAILHMPISYLADSPFADYFIPGLLLTVFVGVGMLSAVALLVLDRPYALELTITTGAALVIFEIAEFSMIGFSPLQVLYGGLGAVVLTLGAHRRFGQRRLSKHAPRRSMAEDRPQGRDR